MKKRVLLWMAGLVFAVTSLFAQDIPVGVVVAFKKGNSQELNRYLGEKVNLVIQNRSESVDRQAAEGTLAAFFSSNKVSGFNVNHEGKRDESSFYYRYPDHCQRQFPDKLLLPQSTEQIFNKSNKNR